MNRRSDWVRLTWTLNLGQCRRRPCSLFAYRFCSTSSRRWLISHRAQSPLFSSWTTTRFTNTRRWFISPGAQFPVSSPWTTTRVVLLSVFASSMAYLYGNSASRLPAAESLQTGDEVPKYATAHEFAKACYGRDCKVPRSFRLLMHHVLGNCGAAPYIIRGRD